MKKIVLLDGGMGQELIRRSTHKPHPMWSAKVLLDEPDIVEAVHCEYINAGARVITLNNYSVTPERLARDGAPEMFNTLQSRAIEIAHRAREKASVNRSTSVKIAGCLPPIYASYRPELAPSLEECIARYRVIAEVQASSVDLILCETMSSIKEAQAAATAAKETNLPVWLSFSIEDNDKSCLRSGESLKDAITAVKNTGIEAVLLNCSIPEAIDAAFDTLTTHFEPVGAYANGFTSIAALEPGGTVDNLEARKDLGPEAYAEIVLNWVKSGARIVGGCCEVGPAHIAALHTQLEKAGYEISDHI